MKNQGLFQVISKTFTLNKIADHSYQVQVQVNSESQACIGLVHTDDFVAISVPFADANDIQAHKVVAGTINSPFGISINGENMYVLKHVFRQETTLDQFKNELSMMFALIQMWSAGAAFSNPIINDFVDEV